MVILQSGQLPTTVITQVYNSHTKQGAKEFYGFLKQLTVTSTS